MASVPTATLHDPARHFEADVLRGVVALQRARRFREAAVARGRASGPMGISSTSTARSACGH